jgi:hypothetical protein
MVFFNIFAKFSEIPASKVAAWTKLIFEIVVSLIAILMAAVKIMEDFKTGKMTGKLILHKLK